jgi:hypothetical protein
LQRKRAPVTNKAFIFIRDDISGRVEHAQFGPKFDRLLREVAAAKDFVLEIDIGEKRVDLLRRTQDRQRLVHVAGRDRFVAPVPYHQLRDLADEHIVFDNQISRPPELFLP